MSGDCLTKRKKTAREHLIWQRGFCRSAGRKFHLGMDYLLSRSRPFICFLSALSSIRWLGIREHWTGRRGNPFGSAFKEKQHHCVSVIFLLRGTRVMVHFIQHRKHKYYREIPSCSTSPVLKLKEAKLQMRCSEECSDFDGILHFCPAGGVSTLLGGGAVEHAWTL